MKLASTLVLALGIAGALPAAAQPTAETGAFLQQRVVEELATDGVVLSRLGVTLKIEIVGEHVLVSLVDLTTHRASASTKIDALPADREAAVAVVTQVASGLASQLGAHPLKPPSTAPLDDSRAREAAELAYRRDAIGFGNDLFIDVDHSKAGTTVSTSTRWYANQGELKIRLDGPDFYKLVERPDLASKYATRRDWKYTAAILGTIGAVAGTIAITSWAAGQDGDHSVCGDFDFDCRRDADKRSQESVSTHLPIGAALFIGGGIGIMVANHLHRNPHPISESEAKTLAAKHNEKLRRRLGLPTASDVTLTPYAAPAGGGLVMSGRF